jgi:hypothetical protein
MPAITNGDVCAMSPTVSSDARPHPGAVGTMYGDCELLGPVSCAAASAPPNLSSAAVNIAVVVPAFIAFASRVETLLRIRLYRRVVTVRRRE